MIGIIRTKKAQNFDRNLSDLDANRYLNDSNELDEKFEDLEEKKKDNKDSTKDMVEIEKNDDKIYSKKFFSDQIENDKWNAKYDNDCKYL